ncbi:MAG TPA: ABC transporter ATP-binding protein [Alphaproteobacteria bacterium]|nr:ABC transporter ATP-binding protein [Alphaproteobacteria bacterium]
MEPGRLPILELRGLSKHFAELVAVDSIDLDILEGEFFTIVGPSGSGKTTVLRMLAGMESPTSGDILLKGERINDVPANRRPTCMVFQSLALFPHRTVGQNIEFAMKIRGVAPKERRARAFELMDLLRLSHSYYGRGVGQISGGERQRVALARAFAYDPQILFFDEPLSAIDYKLRKTLEKELKDIHRESGKTFVYITHSLEEAMVMSDRIGVMRSGRLVQVGSPHEIYTAPRDKFVSEFMGEVNVIDVVADSNGLVFAEAFGVQLTAPAHGPVFQKGHLVIRPESMRFLRQPEDAENRFEGTLYNEYALGSRIQYQIRVGEHVFMVEQLRQHAFAGRLDDRVLIGWNAVDSILVKD